jgi:ribonuclease BN (tRNA processing enzyme)
MSTYYQSIQNHKNKNYQLGIDFLLHEASFDGTIDSDKSIQSKQLLTHFSQRYDFFIDLILLVQKSITDTLDSSLTSVSIPLITCA